MYYENQKWSKMGVGGYISALLNIIHGYHHMICVENNKHSGNKKIKKGFVNPTKMGEYNKPKKWGF